MPFRIEIAISDRNCNFGSKFHFGSKLPFWMKIAFFDQNWQLELPFQTKNYHHGPKISILERPASDQNIRFDQKLLFWARQTFFIQKGLKIFSNCSILFLLKQPFRPKLEVQNNTVIIWFHSGNGITMLKFRNPEGNLIKNIYWVISFFSLILYFTNLTAYLKFLVQ